jgi:hypothetical protein
MVADAAYRPPLAVDGWVLSTHPLVADCFRSQLRCGENVRHCGGGRPGSAATHRWHVLYHIHVVKNCPPMVGGGGGDPGLSAP